MRLGFKKSGRICGRKIKPLIISNENAFDYQLLSGQAATLCLMPCLQSLGSAGVCCSLFEHIALHKATQVQPLNKISPFFAELVVRAVNIHGCVTMGMLNSRVADCAEIVNMAVHVKLVQQTITEDNMSPSVTRFTRGHLWPFSRQLPEHHCSICACT